MAVDKKISYEERRPSDIKVAGDVIEFKPKPNSPFGTPGGWMNEKPKPKTRTTSAATADEQFEFYYSRLSPIYDINFLKKLTIKELDQLLQPLITSMASGGLVSLIGKIK